MHEKQENKLFKSNPSSGKGERKGEEKKRKEKEKWKNFGSWDLQETTG